MGPIALPRADAALWRLRVWRVVAGATALIVLTGCANGTIDNSRRFQSQEATRVQQLPGLQATEIARQFNASPTAPQPTLTPNPGISDLALASSVSSDGSPGNTLRSIPANSSQTVYAVVRISNIQPGQVVSAVWRTEDGAIIASVDQTPEASAAPQWVSFPMQLGGAISRGNYSVAIFIGNDLLQSLAFQAT
ncbi:hypothetical protein BH23CHL4_BH23CHL4_00960 [soil metagenome]